jgi:GNAT superfamily N-acetyltransferase
MIEYKIAFEDSVSSEDRSIVHQGLGSYNDSQVGDGRYRRLSLLVRDKAGNVVGGLFGATYWDWLHVETLWIDERLRGQGYGSRLMVAAEAEALKRDCKNSFLDTTGFQARPFYERQGYKIFGVLEHSPDEHKRFFMQKKLLSDSDNSEA